MFSISLKVRLAVRLAIAGAAAAASTAALSQTATDATGGSKELEEIVITGTRIQAGPNEVSLAPVATITAADIEKTGLVRMEDVLNQMPQFVAGNNSGQSISSDGTATLNLRGLGAEETLVLINGRRMQPGGSNLNISSADINQIPAAMVERVDVLTGGASTTYGADAVAGVVNFIMDTHFQGVRLDYDYGQNTHAQDNEFAQSALRAQGDPLPGNFTGGQNRDWSFMAGSNFADGRGNATVYGTYLNTSPVVGTQLDYAACTLVTARSAPAAGQPWKPVTCGGSPVSATGQFLMIGATAASSFALLYDGTVDKTTGQFRPYTQADNYNYGSLSYLQREAQRYTAGAFLHYDVSENASVYSETMYARNTSTAQYGPSGLFQYGEIPTSCSNPLLTASERAVLCTPANIAANQAIYGGTGDHITLYIARRSVESGGRTDNRDSNSIRQVIGIKGQWGEAWNYDLYGQYGISTLSDSEGGYLGNQQIDNALDVVTDPRTGAPVCASVLTGTDPRCVPWNIWQKGGVTAAQVNYLLQESTYAGTATEYVVDGSVTGDLGRYGIRLPTASTAVRVNLGSEYRQESFSYRPDYIFANGLASGSGGPSPPLDGNLHVNELFFETNVPLVDNRAAAYHLGFEGGYRYSDYSSGFKTNTYKLGLEWAPVEAFKLRGSYNRAVRAPNIGELYAPTTYGTDGADPCWGTAPKFTVAECQLTGLSPQRYGKVAKQPTGGGVNVTGGGNPNLQAEKADTYTLGFVLQPVTLHDLQLSIDYYHLSIDDTISFLDSDTIFNVCAETADPAICGRIHRNPATGSLWQTTAYYVNTNQLNIGTVETSGYDVAATYRRHIGRMGKLSFSFSGTRVTSSSLQPTPISASFDCTGLYGTGCGAPTPKWKHFLEANWATPWAGLLLTARWRYTGPVDADATSPSSQLNAPYQPGFGHIGGYDYIDLSASISWGPSFSFRLGANNVFDKGPPLVLSGNYGSCDDGGNCNDNTWVGTYDTLGRYVYAHISAHF